jgi:hypothetical protein
MLLSMFKSRLESLQSFSSSDRIGMSSCRRASCSSNRFSCFILTSYACCSSLVRCFGIGSSSCLLFAYVCGAGGFFVPGLIRRPEMVQMRRHLQPDRYYYGIFWLPSRILFVTKGQTRETQNLAPQNRGDAKGNRLPRRKNSPMHRVPSTPRSMLGCQV